MKFGMNYLSENLGEKQHFGSKLRAHENLALLAIFPGLPDTWRKNHKSERMGDKKGL